MACPDGARFTAEAFDAAMQNFSLWDAGFCAYATPLGELVVGTVVYVAVGLNIFIRTGSLIIPFVLMLLLGGTIFAQMLAVINSFAALIILVVAPVVVTALVFLLDRG